MVAFLEWLTRGRTQKVALLGFMIGVSVFSHLYTADYYREAWKIQKQFYWQLYWRAPYILPQTALLSDSEVIPSAGTYSTAAALNMIYAEQINDLGNLPYWFFNMSQKFGGQYDRFLSGKSVYAKFRNWGFVGKGDESLLIDNDGKGCAYIIVPDRIENSLLSDSLQAAVANSNLSRILSQSSNKVNSPSAVFGSEPPHTWCFYYEKAELASQQGDWKMVVALGEKANKLGFQPNQAVEWLLFIDGYVKTNNTPSAIKLTQRVSLQDPRVAPLLCTYWQTLDAEQPSLFSQTELSDIEQILKCTDA